MASRGGHRENSGRKPKDEREKVRGLAISSIIKRFGSEEEGFESLLASGEASLIKFVFEHAYGKPKEQIEIPDGITINWHEQKTYK